MAESKQTNKAVPATTTAPPQLPGMDGVMTFFKKYQNYIIGALVLIVGVVVFMVMRGGSTNSDQEMKAQRDFMTSKAHMDRDSFNLALKGDTSGSVGLETIIKKYKGTQAAKEAMLEAAACYLNLGDTKKALDNLEGATGFGKQLEARRLSLLGDAYSIKGTAGAAVNKSDCTKAADYYEDAAEKFEDDDNNAAFYLFKQGQLYEYMGDNAKATAAYKKIKEKYPTTPQMIPVEKYLGKVGVED